MNSFACLKEPQSPQKDLELPSAYGRSTIKWYKRVPYCSNMNIV